MVQTSIPTQFDGQAGFTEMYSHLKSLHSQKRDFLVHTDRITAVAGHLVFETNQPYAIKPSDNMISQVCASLGLPVRYFKKMETDGALDLIDKNLNHWLNQQDKTQMIRTYMGEDGSGVGRAFLSDKYQRMDNLDVIVQIFEQIKATEIPVELKECQLTDDKMFMRFAFPGIKKEAREWLKSYKRPDGQEPDANDLAVYTGLTIGNSETGRGSLFIAPVAIVPQCTNMEVFKSASIRRAHVGAKMEADINWGADTLMANHDLVKLMMRDSINKFLNPDWIGKVVEMREAGMMPLDRPVETVKNLGKALKWSEETTDSVVDAFFRSGDSTTAGVRQAMTWAAKGMAPEARFDMEAMAAEMSDRKIKQNDRELIVA